MRILPLFLPLVTVLPLPRQAVAWTQLNPAGTPAPRRIMNDFARDDAGDHYVMFGGPHVNLGSLGDTWTFDGQTWSQQQVLGPSPRGGHALAYDPTTQQVVLFGGADRTEMNGAVIYGDTWTWNGSAWTHRQPAVAPPARSYAVLVHFPLRNRLLLFTGWDGVHPLDDTWEWDGASWTQVGAVTRYLRRLWSSAGHSKYIWRRP